MELHNHKLPKLILTFMFILLGSLLLLYATSHLGAQNFHLSQHIQKLTSVVSNFVEFDTSIKSDSDNSPDVKSQKKGISCHHHVQLCWLRRFISDKLGYKLTGDIFNMTALYKYQTHVYITNPEFHNPKRYHYKTGLQYLHEAILLKKYINDGLLLKGLSWRNIQIPKGFDISGRNCDYNPFNEYDYSDKVFYSGNKVSIYLTEKPKSRTNNLTLPNYVFGVVQSGHSVVQCKVVEYFTNFTYLIECPIVEQNFLITINATYMTIVTSLFRCSKNLVWNLKKYKHSNLEKDNTVSTKNTVDHTVKVKCSNIQGHASGFWVKVGPIFHWAKKECYYPFYFSEQQVQCLRSKKMVMIGDSHAQNRFYGLKNANGLRNLQHYQAVNVFNLLSLFLDMYRGYINGTEKAEVLAVNVGHHSLREYGLVYYIGGMSDIFKMITKLSKLKNAPEIIWIESTPIADNGFHDGMMTNQIAEAVNDWIDYEMQKLGVKIVHSFDIALPMTGEHRGHGAHYYHYLGKNIGPKKVSVGGAVCSVLAHMLCPNV